MKVFSICSCLLLVLASTGSAATLSGTVIRSDSDEPVAGALVLVRGTGLFGVSAADGTYSVALVPEGHYGLTAAGSGLIGVSIGAVDLTADLNRDFSLDPPPAETISVSGATQCAAGPCPAVMVYVQQEGRTVRRTLSDSSGNYSIVGLNPGPSDFYGIKLGFMRAEALQVEVNGEAPPTVNLSLDSSPGNYTVSGVVGLSDNPLNRSGSTVYLLGQDQEVLAHTTVGGSYTLSGVPAGLLSLLAVHVGYDEHLRIDVLVQGDRSLDFVLDKQGGSSQDPRYHLSGVVSLEDPEGGDPITSRDSRVSLWSGEGQGHWTTLTTADGRYVFEDLLAGEYVLGAAREGYLDQETQAISLSNDQSHDFELLLDPDYDWGPGSGDGDLGCSCSGSPSPSSDLLLLLLWGLAALGLSRRFV